LETIMTNALFGLITAYVWRLPDRLINTRMGFITRWFENPSLKVMLLAFLQVSLFCIPALAFAQLPTVNLTLGDGVASEAGPDPGSFIATRDGGIISQALHLIVAVTGEATFANDYTPSPSMTSLGGNHFRITIPAGQSTETVVIQTIPDGINEGVETVIFTLVDDTTYTVGPDAEAQLTIADDSPEVNLTVGDGTASESGPDPGSFIVTRDGGIISQALHLKVAVTGEATFGNDYIPSPSMTSLGGNLFRITIPPDQLTETVIIQTIPDGINEGDETVIFTLVDDTTYTVGPDAEAQLTIADDSPEVNLTLDDGVASEAGPNPGSFIASRDGGILSKALHLKVAVTGTATFGVDYSNPGMTSLGGNHFRITIPADQLTATVLITPINDGIIEDDETVIFTLVHDVTYTVGEPVTASITIADYVEGIFKDSFEDP
jgi:hypothetical protein